MPGKSSCTFARRRPRALKKPRHCAATWSERSTNRFPPNEIESVIDNIGLPYSAYNYVYSTSAPIGPEDADIMISLNEKHHPTGQYIHDLRLKLNKKFPGVMFYFPARGYRQPDSEFRPAGADRYSNHGPRRRSESRVCEQSDEAVELGHRNRRPADSAALQPAESCTSTWIAPRPLQAGFTQQDVAGNLLVSLSGSFQTSPSFWLDPKSGVSYLVATQAPQYDFQSLQDLENIPVTGGSSGWPGALAAACEPGNDHPRRGNGDGFPLRRADHDRYFWSDARTRPRRCRQGHRHDREPQSQPVCRAARKCLFAARSTRCAVRSSAWWRAWDLQFS